MLNRTHKVVLDTPLKQKRIHVFRLYLWEVYTFVCNIEKIVPILQDVTIFLL